MFAIVGSMLIEAVDGEEYVLVAVVGLHLQPEIAARSATPFLLYSFMLGGTRAPIGTTQPRNSSHAQSTPPRAHLVPG